MFSLILLVEQHIHTYPENKKLTGVYCKKYPLLPVIHFFWNDNDLYSCGKASKTHLTFNVKQKFWLLQIG